MFMKSTVRSLWMWVSTVVVIIIWLPLLGLIYLFDRNPSRFITGRWFRRLGMAMIKLNPAWRVHISGKEHFDPGQAYVVVSNHQSLVDIPIISCLPWEMKWIAKAELFRIPVVGWMMRMAGDIPLDRKQRGGAQALLRAKRYLQHKCPVMVFPEGTRSPDGLTHSFTDGAFHLAVKAQVPVLPLVIEGSHPCLEKGSWKFGEPQDIFLKVLPAMKTTGLTSKDTVMLRDRVRRLIVEQLAQMRGAQPQEVDALLSRSRTEETPSMDSQPSR
jgi:1-acyl-sn-glycerol-3-phosphate acyltransferase